MFRLFEGRSADDVWQRIATAFVNADGTSHQASRAGSTSEILHAAISIVDPVQRWVVSRNPPINPAFAIAEVVWIITGRNDAEFLNYFNRDLPKFAGDCPVYHGAYGHRLCRHFGIDQLNRAYHALTHKPETRQVVLQIWDGSVDLPDLRGRESAPDIPCNINSILKIRGGKLEWMQILRSNDIYRGLPYNIVQFTTLQEVIAGWLGIAVGSYNHLSDSLHVYDDCLRNLEALFQNEIAVNTDSLRLPREESLRVFRELGRHIETVIREETTTDRLSSIVRQSGLPVAFQNMLCLLCAEGARRRQSIDVAAQIMEGCTNPAFKQIFERWLGRFPARNVSLSFAFRA